MTVGDSISTLEDEEQNFDLTGGSPTVVDDGDMALPYLSFGGADDDLDENNSSIDMPVTIASVLKVEDKSTDRAAFYDYSSTGHIGPYHSDYADAWNLRGDDAVQVRSPTIGETVVAIGVIRGSRTDDTIRIWNGETLDENTGDAQTGGTYEGMIMGSLDGSNYWLGGIGETLRYDGEPDLDEVQDYLSRWLP